MHRRGAAGGWHRHSALLCRGLLHRHVRPKPSFVGFHLLNLPTLHLAPRIPSALKGGQPRLGDPRDAIVIHSPARCPAAPWVHNCVRGDRCLGVPPPNFAGVPYPNSDCWGVPWATRLPTWCRCFSVGAPRLRGGLRLAPSNDGAQSRNWPWSRWYEPCLRCFTIAVPPPFIGAWGHRRTARPTPLPRTPLPPVPPVAHTGSLVPWVDLLRAGGKS